MLDKIEAFADQFDMFPAGGRILAAVSGGADSVCLLSALLELSRKRTFSVTCAHFNHRLRGEESDRDARFVQELCQSQNVDFYLDSADVAAYAAQEGLGIEEAARKFRYRFFDETAKIIGAQRIATAHTADDNVETVLLNMTRGAGLRGLCGIPPVRDRVIRPMLGVTREEVLEYLDTRSISFVEDSTNQLDIYNRNLIRHTVIPVLKSINPRLAETVASTTLLLREDDTCLSASAEQFVSEHYHNGRLKAKALLELPLPISRRVIRLLAGRQSSSVALSSKHVAAVLALCASEDPSGEVALPSSKVYREYSELVFFDEHRCTGFLPIQLKISEKTLIPELGLSVSCRKTVCDNTNREKINNSFITFLFKYDNICDKIVIRPRKTGDIIDIFGRNGTKSLKKLFIENRIPLKKRPLIPVLADGKGVLAVYGIGFDKRAACDVGDTILEIIFEETAYEK